ncbi:MAG: ribokinase [Caldilineae bacterium]|nr:MAG: ribokinase [Caldilineae bacterium]
MKHKPHPHIVVVGSINMDLVARSPRIPAPGETIIGHDFHTVPGGKGANQAVAAARLGARVGLVARVGRDTFGRELIDGLAANGVAADHVRETPDVATGIAVILVDDTGENSIVVAPGANMAVSEQDIEAAAGLIAAADVLLLQLEIPDAAVLKAAALARAASVPVILNPAPARPLPPDLLSLVDILIPNEHEAALLAGHPLGSEEDMDVAARRLLERGPRAVILTLGSRGALLFDDDDRVRQPAFTVEAVDTTAAGDAFVAGFAVAWAEGKTTAEAVRWGAAAGALAATRLGAQPSLPRRSALLSLLQTA